MFLFTNRMLITELLTRIWCQDSFHISEHFFGPIFGRLGPIRQVFKMSIKFCFLWLAQSLFCHLKSINNQMTSELQQCTQQFINKGQTKTTESVDRFQHKTNTALNVSFSIIWRLNKTKEFGRTQNCALKLKVKKARRRKVAEYYRWQQIFASKRQRQCCHRSNTIVWVTVTAPTWTTRLRAAPASFTSFFMLKSMSERFTTLFWSLAFLFIDYCSTRDTITI